MQKKSSFLKKQLEKLADKNMNEELILGLNKSDEEEDYYPN